MTTNSELRALLAEAKGVIEGLDAIISGEVSKEWADFFGKDYEDMSACLSRITAALAEKDGGGKLTEIPYVLTIKWDHGETVHRGVMPLPPLPTERKV